MVYKAQAILYRRVVVVFTVYKKDIFEQRNAALKRHNDLRALHGSPPLQLNDELNMIAQGWAENLAVTMAFEHSPNEQLGENLASHTGSMITGDTSNAYNIKKLLVIVRSFDKC
jgi:hypothetical protein